jgi:hypothetical protein
LPYRQQGVVPTQELFIGRDRACPVRNIGTVLNAIRAIKHSSTYNNALLPVVHEPELFTIKPKSMMVTTRLYGVKMGIIQSFLRLYKNDFREK